MDGPAGRSVYHPAPLPPVVAPVAELDAPQPRGRASSSSLASNEERWREALETEY